MSEQVAKEKKPFDAKSFFTNKKNIFSMVGVLFGILAVVLFLVLPVVQISLTPEGVALASKNAATIPDMASYHEVLGGAKVLFGNGSYNVWINSGTSAYSRPEQMAFNVPLLIGLIFILAASIALLVMLILRKNNIINKFILGLFVLGAVVLILTPVWFYMVNPIVASTRYDTSATIYPYGSVNAHGEIGMILSAAFAIISCVASGMLIVKKDDKAR